MTSAMDPRIENDDRPPAEAQTEFQGARWRASLPVPEPDPPDALEYDPLSTDW